MPGDLTYYPVKLECPHLWLRLEICESPSYPGDRTPDLGNRISGDTSSDSSSFRASQWLLDCLANHDQCGPGNSNKARPSRLLHVGKTWYGQGDLEVKLLDYPNITDRVTPRDPEYACLSYCWGGISDMTTTRANLYKRTLGIDWESLPKTFQHAIEFTRRMQINYLWIDALCIIQDDPEDWQREAARMGDIYSNAFFTISAMTGSNSRAGLFSKSSSGRAPVRPFYIPAEGPAHVLFRVREILPHRGMYFDDSNGYSSWTGDYQDGLFPLLRRAWVYQERLLSRRIVHFTPHELVWECKGNAHCECGQIKQGDNANSEGLLSASRIDAQKYSVIKSNMRWWHSKVEVYSKLDLTYASDKLPALSGIAAMVQQRVGGQYLAGLFAVDLWNELLWRIDDLDGGEDRWFGKSRRTRRAPEYQGPSWSWISLSGGFDGLYFPHDSDSRALETDGRYVQILEIKYTPVGLDPCGQVSSTHMVLAGFLAPCLLRYPLERADPEGGRNKSSLHYLYYVQFKKYELLIFADYPFDEPGPHHIPERTRLYCLRIGKAKWEQRDKSRDYGGRKPPRVPVWKTADLLVLRRTGADTDADTAVDGQIARQFPRRWRSEEMCTYERVGLLSGFSTLLQGSAPGQLAMMNEEADEEIFDQVERSVFRLI
ncbi:uncharacterized protein A1O9_06414 [Exophiala aquamarina CBS 119918]|uniref:Heterokaryon incompatibility domain-containing protein n=1 Tax=Exophiala aquamarina CBS 119918 TaxID=1182545 RepID=A0A072PGQ1_9EURO|nr:uncharacterized protein A1O9_06414 [Exophiala aquamarina CBS 119918]KEF58488.1 hypothetical protein A1O9_06414 [Exophiala aquamarina CBS 119918]